MKNKHMNLTSNGVRELQIITIRPIGILYAYNMPIYIIVIITYYTY